MKSRFADDVYGLGSPGSPDRTPTVKQSGLSPSEVAAWNKGQQAAVVGAQNLAVKKHGAFNWQNFQPMCEPGHDEPCSNGWTGMGAPTQETCVNGAPDFAHGKGISCACVPATRCCHVPAASDDEDDDEFYDEMLRRNEI